MSAVPPPDFEPPEPHRYTDVGNASRLVAMFGHQLRHVGPWNTWLRDDGRRWQRDTKGQVIEHAKAVAASLWEQAHRETDSDERKRAVKWALQSEGAGRIEAMVKLARSHPTIGVDPHEFDADPWVLNVANGVLDLRTGTLLSHDPRRLITKLADVSYDPSAAAPRWHAFLDQICPDPDVRAFWATWIGYCLTGDVSEHKLVFGVGAGANGKTTMLNTVARILGDYARQAAPDLLMRRRDDPHPTGLADLQGARLVLATETSQGRHLDEALVKRLTGGDRIKARLMHQDFFEFDPSHKLFVATNHRPGIEGTDHGIWRRVRLVPFDVTIRDEDQDKHLDDKLAAEAAGILNWALAGCLTWQRHGLNEPAAILAATADYRAEMDTIGDYISDCCLLVDGVSARASNLYASYTRWCEAAGERPITQRRFGASLRERGLTKRSSNGVIWDGIGLKLDPSSAGDRTESAGQRHLLGGME